MRITSKQLKRMIKEEISQLNEYGRKSSFYLGFFSKPENRVSDEELEYYLEDPLDISMPVAVAFHPKMHRERVRYVKAALQQCEIPDKPGILSIGHRDRTPIDLGREEDKLKLRLKQIKTEQSPIADKIQNLYALDPNHVDILPLTKKLESYNKELESIHSRIKEISQIMSDRTFRQSGEAVQWAVDSAAMSQICKALQQAGNRETALRKFLNGPFSWYSEYIRENKEELSSIK